MKSRFLRLQAPPVPGFFPNPDCFKIGEIMHGREDVIVKDPEIIAGTPVFRRTRVPFQILVDYLEAEIHWTNSRMISRP